MSGTVNAQVSADIAAFQAAMAQATASMNAFAASAQQASSQASSAFSAMSSSAQSATNNMRSGMSSANSAASSLSSGLGTLGISADLAARKLSAVIDESLAGRWRQFDGTLASIVTRILAANAALGGMVVAAGAAAAAVGYLAYQWIATANAIKQTAGEMVTMGTAGKDAIDKITASIKHNKEDMNLWPGEARKVEEALGRLPPAAQQFRKSIGDVSIQLANVNRADIGKTADQVTEAFAKGGKGAEEWANRLHLLDNAVTPTGESLKSFVHTAAEAGHDQEVFNAILGAAKKRVGEYGQALIDHDIAMQKWMRDAAMAGEGGGAFMPPPPEAPKMPELTVDPNVQQQTDSVDRLNTALARREKLTMELDDAQKALTRDQQAGNLGAVARDQEAIATAQKELNSIHTTTEENAHRATQATLEEAVASAKTAHEKLDAEKKLAEETISFYKEGSTEAVAARERVSQAEKQAAREDYQVQSLKYEQEIAADKGNLAAKKKVFDEWLAYAKGIYGENSTEYQQILLRETEAMHAHVAAGVDMTKEGFRQQIAAAEGNYKEQLRLEDQLLDYLKQKYGERSKEYQREALHRIEIANREAKEEAAIAADAARTQEAIARSQERMAERARAAETGPKFSILELLGFSKADTSAFEEQMQQVVEAHGEAMAAIKKQQADAVSDREMQSALNAEKREMQNFAEEAQKINIQESNAVKKAWESVSDSIATDLGSSLTKMVTGQQTAMRTIGSLVEKMTQQVLTYSLKMVGRWIADRLKEVFFTQSSEAGKTAATAAGTATRTGINTAANAKDSAGFVVRLFRWIAQELGMTGATTAGATARTAEETAADAKSAAETSTVNEAKAQSNIGVAATGAAASVAAIPFVGWVMAPGVAATTEAALQPFAAQAALAVGAWDVPRDMVAQIHKNEMVVPADFASGLRGQLSGTGPANPIALNFSPTVSMSGGSGGLTRNSVQTVMSQASAHMYNYMRNVYRNGTLILPGSRMA